MITELFIEETLPDYSYQIIWRAGHELQPEDWGKALAELQSLPTKNRLELWSKAHAESPKGFAPMAFREKNQRKIKISNTLLMLLGYKSGDAIDLPGSTKVLVES